MPRLLSALALFLTVSAWAEPPPAQQLTPAEREKKQKQAKDLLRKAHRLQREGELVSAAAAAAEMLAIEKSLYGPDHQEVASSLGFLATLQEKHGDYKSAATTHREEARVKGRLFGSTHWRAVDAVQAARFAEKVAALPKDKRSALQQAAQRHKEGADLIQAGKHKEALVKFQQVLRLRGSALGEKDPEYARALSHLVALHRDMGNYKAALPLAQQARSIREQALGENHPDYANSLSNLALVHQALDDHQAALPYLKQALRVYKETLSDRHPNYALALHNLAALYQEMGNPWAALPHCKQALAIRKQITDVLGDKHAAPYAASLNQLATLLEDTGDHRAALPFFEQALALRKKVLTEKHPDYAESLNYLALFCKDMGDHKRALALYQQALAVRKEVLGEKHPDYASSLSNLAVLYKVMGDHRSALPLFRQALALCEAQHREKHPDYALYLNNLGTLYQELGDHDAALPLFQQALEVIKEGLGERHPRYAQGLNNLAMLYHVMGGDRAERALKLYQQAQKVTREARGENHPDYATCLHNLAVLRHSRGDHAEALKLLKQALAIRKEAQGEKHPAYATSLRALATLRQDMGEHKEALALFQEAVSLRKEVLGEKHPDYAESLTNLAQIRKARGDDAEALKLSQSAIHLTRDHLQTTASVQSERQQMAASQRVRSRLNLFLSLTAASPRHLRASHAEVLAWKGAALARQRQLRLGRLVAGSQLAPTFAELQAVSSELATRSLATPRPGQLAGHLRRLAELTRRKETLEADLARASAEFRREQNHARLNTAALQKLLPADAALVDFLFYDHFHPTRAPGQRFERRLVAFVVRRDRLARLDLGPAARVVEDVRAWRRELGEARAGAGKAGWSLRQRVWQPVEKHLKGATVVLISPDGALARLPFAALPGSKPGSFLLEEPYALAVVPVPQMLPEMLERPKGPAKAPDDSLLLVGDVDFDGEPGAENRAGTARAAARAGLLLRWPPLSGTRQEAASIKDSFERTHGRARATYLREQKATLSAVRQEASKHRYLHFATHGFFAPEEVRSALAPARINQAELFGREGVAGWHPLLLSGLVLAGANRPPRAGQQDGILTALEVAEMDLGKCELAVLSACETGLGKVAGGEGVLGLQRAFQVAGARSTIASLWKVDDNATRDVMSYFYEKLWDKKSPLAKVHALRDAQRDILKNGVKRGMRPVGAPGANRTPPYFWAAFVLAGDWR
jgi:CHAT domain-containing protein/Tfp pilus assembly protein PilF